MVTGEAGTAAATGTLMPPQKACLLPTLLPRTAPSPCPLLLSLPSSYPHLLPSPHTPQSGPIHSALLLTL